MTKDRHLYHSYCESITHSILIFNKALPGACGSRVTGKFGVRLKADFTKKRGHNFTLISASPGEESSFQLSLNEELAVENAWSGIKRRAWDSLINMIGCSDRVRGKQCNDLIGAKSSISKAIEDLIN